VGQSIILITPGAGWLSYTPGTSYPFWSAFTTYMGHSGTILFPGHHTGKISNTLHSISYLNFTPVNPYIHRRWLQCTKFHPSAQ